MPKLMLFLSFVLLFGACGGSMVESSTPGPTALPTQMPSATPTPTAQPTATLTPTTLPTPTAVSSPTVTPLANPLDIEWVYYEVPSQQYYVALPSTWEQIDMDQKSLDAMANALEEENEALREIVQGEQLNQLFQSGVTFYGFDFSLESLASDFHTNVNISREALPIPLSLDDLLEFTVASLEPIDIIVTPVESHILELPAGQAGQLHYEMSLALPDGAAVTTDVTQYIFLSDDSAYILTMSAKAGEAAPYRPVFQGIAERFGLGALPETTSQN